MPKHIFLTIIVAASTALVTSIICFTFFEYQINAKYRIKSSQVKEVQLANHVNVKPYSDIENFVATSKSVTPSVVSITVYRGDYKVSGGSGVVISRDGYIITNNHVIEGASFYEVILFNKKELTAKLIGTDPSTDLALLKVESNDLSPLRIGDSDALSVGEWVLAVGNPFNLNSTVTAGIVSAKARDIQILRSDYSIESFIQTDAVVNPGNSGGALVNVKGELMGINTAIISESGGYEGFSFAIPSNLMIKIASDLKEFGEVQRAVLGITISDVNSQIAQELKLKKVEGVHVRSVIEGTSAADAKLMSGDVITAINGVETKSMPELQEQVARYRPGDIISIDYIRAGITYRKNNVTLKSIKASSNE